MIFHVVFQYKIFNISSRLDMPGDILQNNPPEKICYR